MLRALEERKRGRKAVFRFFSPHPSFSYLRREEEGKR